MRGHLFFSVRLARSGLRRGGWVGGVHIAGSTFREVRIHRRIARRTGCIGHDRKNHREKRKICHLWSKTVVRCQKTEAECMCEKTAGKETLVGEGTKLRWDGKAGVLDLRNLHSKE